MPTRKEFEEYVKLLEERIKWIQNLKLDEKEKEKLTDELLEKLSIATKYFLPDEDEN